MAQSGAATALSIFGMVVGAILAAPTGGMSVAMGASLGYAAGSIIGSLLFPPDPIQQHGPKLKEVTVTGSEYGVPVTRLWGGVRVPGNIIWSSGLKEHEHTETVTQGGFLGWGGQETKITTYTYTMDLAVGLCEGELDNLTRIWAGHRVILDRRGENTSGWQKEPWLRYTLYDGTETQDPDPLMVRALGEGNVPAYRGLAYIVFKDFDLTEFGNLLPNLEFELWRSTTAAQSESKPWTGFNVVRDSVAYDYETGLLWTLYGNVSVYPFGYATAVRVADAHSGQELFNTGDLRDVSSTYTFNALESIQIDYVNDRVIVYAGQEAETKNIGVIYLDRYTGEVLDVDIGEHAGGDDAIYFTQGVWLHTELSHLMVTTQQGFDGRGFIFQGFWTEYQHLDCDEDGVKEPYQNNVWNAEELDGGFEYINRVQELNRWVDAEGETYPYPVQNPYREMGYSRLTQEQIGCPFPLERYPRILVACQEFLHVVTLGNLVGWPPCGPDLWTLMRASQDWHLGRADLDDGNEETGTEDTAVFQGPPGYFWDWRRDTLIVWASDDPAVDHQDWVWVWNLQTNQRRQLSFAHKVTGGYYDWADDRYVLWAAGTGWPSSGGAVYYLYDPGDDPSQPDPEDQPSSSSDIPLADWTLLFQSDGEVGWWSSWGGWRPPESDDYIWQAGGSPLAKIPLKPLPDEMPLLSDVTQEILLMPGDLVAGDIDVTDLAAEGKRVRGYPVQRLSTPRAMLEPLRKAYVFDVVESDWKLKARHRPTTADVTLEENDLGAYAQGTEAPPRISITRRQDPELPAEVDLRYSDPDLDYQVGLQRAKKHTGQAESIVGTDLPLVLTADEAASVAHVLLHQDWVSRLQYQVAVPRKYLKTDPGDLIEIPHEEVAGDYREMLAQRVSVDPSGVVTIEGVRDAPDGYSIEVSGQSAWPDRPVTTPILLEVLPSISHLLDIPLLWDGDDATKYGAYLMASSVKAGSGNWPGAVLENYTSAAGGFVAVAEVQGTNQAVFGTATGLGPGPTTVWDLTSTVTVTLMDPDRTVFTPATALEVLNGANAALVGDEIIQFRTATKNSDGTWTLSKLLRGRRGTEWATRDQDTRSTVLDEEGNGLTKSLRFYYLGTLFTPRLRGSWGEDGLSTGVVLRTRTSGGRALLTPTRYYDLDGEGARPYAPVHVEAANDGESSPGLDISWVRRTRVGGEWIDRTDVPLSEDVEEYTVEILDESGTVRRTYTVTDAETVNYSAADIAADWPELP